MLYDCAVIGGGPAGLNAALVLGRARRKVLLFDNNKPRNAVTQESHGFITRDGVKPDEFRAIAHRDIRKYPSVEYINQEVTALNPHNGSYRLVTNAGGSFDAKTVILATGLKEFLPDIGGIRDFYGKSLFSCPYCDGWELRDKPLVLIAEGQQIVHMAKIIYNWSRDLLICSNGKPNMSPEQKAMLQNKGMRIMERKITGFIGESGQLKQIIFEDGTAVRRDGGFVLPSWVQAAAFGVSLGCETNPMGGILTDAFGRTNIRGVYAAGDTSVIAPSQLIIAAAEGSRAAMGVNTDLTQEEFAY